MNKDLTYGIKGERRKPKMFNGAWEKSNNGQRYMLSVDTPDYGPIWVRSAEIVRGDGRYDSLWEHNVKKVAKKAMNGEYQYKIYGNMMTVPGTM